VPATLRTETADGVRHIVLTRASEYNTITGVLRVGRAAPPARHPSLRTAGLSDEGVEAFRLLAGFAGA
jgi:hypothetical protein